MASTTVITCKCGCGKKKEVRIVDINRGWGLFYNKACATRHRFTGKPQKPRNKRKPAKKDDGGMVSIFDTGHISNLWPATKQH